MKDPRAERLLRLRRNMEVSRSAVPPATADDDLLFSFRLPPAPHPRKRKSVARNMAAHAPQVKPKAYRPILASCPFARKSLRALTKVALGLC
jgi:hypothetical protein